MEGVLIALLIVGAVASRPIEARLWRAGRLSDRATTILLIGRLPVVIFLYSLIQGYTLVFILLATLISLIGPVIFYRYVLGLLREERANWPTHR